MSRPLVLVTCRQMQVELPQHLERIEALGYEVVAPDLGDRQQFTATELLEHGDGRMVGIIAGDDELSRSFIEGSPALRVLIRWGIGMDSVDHDAAAEHGVVVRNTPGVFGQEVADSAMGYVLALARGYLEVDQAVRAGAWPKYEGFTLAGSTLGIVGYGVIGREIARRAMAFGMRVVAADPYASSPERGVELVPNDEIFRQSRVVVLACPLSAETHHLVNTNRLSLMRSDAVLVNVSRGPVVDEAALVAALQDGRIAGAALDVFEIEPLPMMSPLRQMPHVILGAHNGSNTREGVVRASAKAVDYLIEELSV